nr:immunoglobulin heavy chain junction region [Mus musculus]MBK4197735.1 immunoglobulin heavy chain junction region [Mus musculus]
CARHEDDGYYPRYFDVW